ncbi:MAG: nucleotidyltransferase family protein [Lachnospiraceae bacterium]|nr:nucleotidyltransferase family protein [Lachnospiraceae bacterium]
MAKIAGIIAEYDPFHAGHAYHIEETRRRSGADGIVCVMSGAFVQRGGPAFLDKYARAEAAVRGGADLVLELPPACASASAEGFAHGGVSLLAACGCIDTLSFGAETDDLQLLEAAADALSDPLLTEDAKAFMREGRSYAAALAAALEARDPAMAAVIATPNNMLAVEYLKALKTVNGAAGISPLAVKRVGAAYHDDEYRGEGLTGAAATGPEDPARPAYPSASSIRKAVREGQYTGAEDYSLVLGPEAMAAPLMSKLRTLAYIGADLTVYEDVSSDLAARILAAAPFTLSYAELCDRIVTRAFTLARVKRALTHILLEIRKGDSRKAPAYLKVLALREGSPAVRAFAQKALLPRITKDADDTAGLAADSRFAQDIYHQMVFAAHGTALPDDFRRSPFVLHA